MLSSLACDCDLVAHVSTQAPYALLMSMFAVLCGTLPIGYAVWPNIIGYLIGWAITIVWVVFYCVRIVNATGRFSPATELWLRYVKKGNSELEVLRVDTVKFFNEEATVAGEDKEEGSEEDNLVKTKDGTEEQPMSYDEESPDEKSPVDAEEAVPVEDDDEVEVPDSSFVQESMHSERSYTT